LLQNPRARLIVLGQRRNPEEFSNTLRFHALRLHEVGMMKTDPHKLISRGTDWHFLKELRNELKA
jgi:hypothetical protein